MPEGLFSLASLGVFAVVGAAYAAFAEMAWTHFGATNIGFSFFPAAGVSLGCLVVLPRHRWPSVLAAVVVAEIAVDLANGLAVSPSVGYAICPGGERCGYNFT